MLFSGQPQGRHYWLGDRFVMAPLPMMSAPPPQAPGSPPPPPPSVGQPPFQGQINDGGGSNTVGGGPTSSAAAPGGFSSTGEANRASSPSIAGPSYSTAGSIAGTIAGGLLGGPLGALAGAALSSFGGYKGADKANENLGVLGLEQNIDPGKAAMANLASFGPLSLAPSYTTSGQLSDKHSMTDIGLAEMANFAKGYDGMSLTGFDSPEMDAQYGMASMSPLSAAMAPMGLLGWGGYPNDITSLGSPGLGGYGNLGTEHSYGLVDGNLVGNYTGNENSGPGPSSDGGGSMSGTAGDPGADGGPSGPWNKGGMIPKRRDTVAGPDDQVITAKSGEYVIRPEMVAHYGRGLLDALNSGRIPKGLLFG